MAQSPFKGKIGRIARAEIINMPKDRRSKRTNENLEEDEKSFEQEFIIGSIIDDEFCKYATENINPKYLSSEICQEMFRWIFEFHSKYGTAPKRHIDEWISSKSRSQLNDDYTKVYSNILSRLGQKHREKQINFDYLKERAAHYQDKRILQNKIEEAISLIDNNELSEAIEIMQYESKVSDVLSTQLSRCIISSTEFINREIPRPRRFLRPWLAEGSLTLIYGPRGVGKTWLCTLIAICLTRQIQDDLHIGPWEAKRQAGVLYVDAEMNNWEMQDNIKRLVNPLAKEAPHSPLMILSAHDFAQQFERQLNISEKETRGAISEILRKKENIRVLILDNTAALSPGLDENRKEAWDPINQWMISLRHLGIATILVHHAGKKGQQRGTSGREDAMDTIIRLDKPDGYNPAFDYAWFKISFEKSRNLQPGDSKAPFSIRIIADLEDGLSWQEEKIGEDATKRRKRIIAEILRGLSGKEIAKRFGCTPSYVSQCKKQARKDGYLDKHDKPTGSGRKLMDEFREDYDDSPD